MADPLISIIMPTHKAADTVVRAVNSVLSQTWAQFELIMAVDDGLDYLALLQKAGISDPRIRVASTGGNGTGDWNARNTGLAAAEGAFITLLDSDDAYAPERLARMLPLAMADGAALDDTTLFLEGQMIASLLHPEDNYVGEAIPASAPLILRDRVPVFPMWRRDIADLGQFPTNLNQIGRDKLPAINVIERRAASQATHGALAWRQLPHGSDVVFSLELLSAAPAMRVTPYAGYLYYKRQGSMTLSDSMTERSRDAYHQIIAGIVTGDYALASEVSDIALYEIAKNLNQAIPFGRSLAEDPMLTHEMCARTFNAQAMTEAERYAVFTGKTPS
ncbi:MAG: glycosyltransferase family 2 protein [Alphaproteobacteria bacterium]|jgi:succinoglycan biosynthesis protein ExoO|nr:glycosyltransferase family 2 protein [Alphaproteobacteria bacterium]